MTYKEMCNEDKIAAILEVHFSRDEFELAEQYIEALQKNDHAAIENFESFGEYPRQMIANKIHFERAVSVFGFTDMRFSEYGWAECEAFLDCETFVFGCGIKGNIGRNSVTIGRGPSGKWAYGIDSWASTSGRCSGLSIFGEAYDSRRACLRHGLEEMIEWHILANDKKTMPIIREAKDMLDEIMGRKQKQLSLL